MIDLDPNLAAFYAMGAELAQDHEGHWVVFHQGRLVGFYSGREDAVEMAAIRFGRAPSLIRQVDPSDSVGAQAGNRTFRQSAAVG
jgi:hypothetical protein